MPDRTDILGILTRELNGLAKTEEITIWEKRRTTESVEISTPPGHDRPAIVLVENRPAGVNDETFLHDFMLLRMKLDRANPGKDIVIYLMIGSKIISDLEKKAGMTFVVQSILALRFGLFITRGSELFYAEHGRGPRYHIERRERTDFGYWDRLDALSDRISELVLAKLRSGRI